MTGRTRTTAAAAALMVALGLAAHARAQVFTGRVDVTVEDSSGARLPGANVDLTGPAADSQISDALGQARFLNLPVGTYAVKVALPGFSPNTHSNAATDSRHELERANESWTDPDRGEVATISGEHSVNLPPLRDRSDCSIDQSQAEVLELRVEFESPSNVGREWQFVFVAGSWVEDFRHELAHRGAILSKEVVHFGEDKSWDDDEGGRRQNIFVLWEAGSAVRCARERP